MKCGIVILNTNDFQTSNDLLLQIKDYNSLDKIVVVDNNSTDGSYEKLRQFENDKIKVIQAGVNKGYSYGNNVGIRYLLNETDIDIIGISNPDVEFSENFITQIKDDFDKHKDYAVITGLQKAPNGEPAGHAFWPNYSTKDYLTKRFLGLRIPYHTLHRNFDTDYQMRKLQSKEAFLKVGAVEGSLFFVSRDVISKVGLLDDNVFIYFEEDILAKKVSNLGLKVGVDRSISYIHYGAQTTNKVFTSKTKVEHQYNSAKYFFENYQSCNPLSKFADLVLLNIWKAEELSVMKIKGSMKK